MADYNGVVEYVDYGRAQGRSEQRLESVWFGAGSHTKARAFQKAKEMLAAAGRARR